MKSQKILALILFVFCTFAFGQNEIKTINIVNSFQRWPQDVQHNVYLNSLVEKISKRITGVRVGVYSGEPLRPTQAFDYVGNGRSTMMWTQSSYLSSKEYSFALLSQPLFISSQQFFKWRVTPMATQSIDWNELSSSDRLGIEQVCSQSIQDSLSRSRKLALDGADKYNKAGIPVVPLPAQDVAVMQAKWLELVAKQSAFDPVFESLYKSMYGK